jgi:hypothetical protein
MENNIEKIARKRKERDQLFAALERKLDRILAATEAKGIIGQSATSSPRIIDEGLAVLGARSTNPTTGQLADMAVHGRQGSGKNPRRRRMGN